MVGWSVVGWDPRPDIPWSEFERALTWGSGWRSDGAKLPPRPRPEPPAPETPRTPPAVPWAELHCHSAYSFLDGASEPEELVAEAAFQGVETVAITDHDGMYGVVKFAEAAREAGIATVFGAELSLELTRRQNGIPDPEGRHLLVLARDPDGYRRLSAAISAAQLRGSKGRPVYDLDELAAAHDGRWVILTGCRKGLVPAALAAGGPPAAAAELRRLVELFGAENVVVELIDHDQPLDDDRNDTLYTLAGEVGVGVVASNNVHYATPAGRRLAQVLAAARATTSLAELDGWLPAAGGAFLRSGEEMRARLARYPGVLETTVELGQACAFDLSLIRPELPDREVPDGHTDASWLRHQVAAGAAARYGPPGPSTQRAYAQIAHELDVIEQLNFPGYFLIVHEITEFCRREGILCQGR
ncbi:PHP domain-containing protein, partial [Jiangella rhizosphaerae]|uniref:PHP domain-containing protein n=1 Tax=Jiangella rhizosphaerae TaxID=2293569 RepID=UPI0018F5E83D